MLWANSYHSSGGAAVDLFRDQNVLGPPSYRKFVQENGDKRITRMMVCRRPLPGAIIKVADAITKGNFSGTVKRLGYDDVFHLFLIITLDDGSSWVMEKNHVLSVHRANPGQTGSETICKPVPIGNKILTLSQLIRPVVQVQGPNYAHYTFDEWNCQRYVDDTLKYSGLLTPDLHKFIYQDAKEIAATIPSFGRWLASKATNLAARLDQVIHGSGRFGQDPKTFTPQTLRLGSRSR